MTDNTRLVYSTDGGRVEPPPQVRASIAPAPRRRRAAKSGEDPADGVVRIRREKGGQRGKTATTVTGLPGAEADLDALLKQVKQFLGSGGSRTGRTLEIQGDHRDRLQQKLESLGYKVKLAGG